MTEHEVAVLADIHGNKWALEAVLEDINERGITEIVNLGDSVYGPLDPAGTAELLIAQGDMLNIRGNQDRVILETPDALVGNDTMRYVKQSLQPQHLDWLAAQNPCEVFKGMFLFHGSPTRDDEYLLEEVTEHAVFLRSDVDLRSMLVDCEQRVVLCGHSHLPNAVWLSDGRLVVNPGSVGLPAYIDERPFQHSMETGSPHARYCVISMDERRCQVHHIALTYEWEEVAARALGNGRPDWAEWIATGRSRRTTAHSDNL